MRPAVLPTVFIVCVLIASIAVATPTVVAVAGRRAILPCTSGADSKSICWGRGMPSVFTCHKAVLVSKGHRVTHRISYRYKLPSDKSSGDVSLTIYNTRQADSGFYHCRVDLPGLFNDQVYVVHLIIINVLGQTLKPVPTEHIAVTSEMGPVDERTELTEFYLGSTLTEATEESGSGAPEDPILVSRVKSSQPDLQLISPQSFIGNTLRLSFIIFIPALLLTIGYKLMRLSQKRRQIPSDQEDSI